MIRRAWEALRDAAVVALAYVAALALRFDGEPPADSWTTFGIAFPLIAAVYIGSNYFLGIYRTAWLYGGLPDALNLARSVVLATAIISAANVFVPERDLPLSVNVIAGLLAYFGMGGVKLWPRVSRAWGSEGQRVIVVGAGHTGQLVVREFLANAAWRYHPIGFLDDDPGKRGVRIHGVPVLGTTADTARIVRRDMVELVVVALPHRSRQTIGEVLEQCAAAGVRVRMVPGLDETVRGQIGPGDLREVTVEDLLSRDPVPIDYSLCSAALRGRSLLITAAAGSIGSELARQVLAFEPLNLVLLDNNESALHDLQLELASAGGESALRAVVGDITNREKIRGVMQAVRPQVVFHAAAYKHVPLMEEFPEEAFRVNVLGTMNVFDAAAEFGAGKVVFVSSDKAVNATSVLGVTKRIGELLVMARGAASETVFCAVRFGNVIGSRGSVVPTFWSQIDRGGPVSVTDPGATRYFLTVPEAVSLVIEAAAFAGQGQIYILDMGDEIRILQLAEKMIRMRGLRPHEDVAIEYTGLRPGEKLHEELVGAGERTVPTRQAKILATEGGAAPSLADLTARIAATANSGATGPGLAVELHAIAGSGVYPPLGETPPRLADPG